MRIKIYLLEIFNRFLKNLFKALTGFYSITGKFFTTALVKIQANPIIISYGIASIPLAVFIFTYLWYGPNFGDPTPPPPPPLSAPGISVAVQRSMVDRFCSDVSVFRHTWLFLSPEIQNVLKPFLEPFLAVDYDACIRGWMGIDEWPYDMHEIGKEVADRLASPQTELQRQALISMEYYFNFIDYLLTSLPSSYDKVYGKTLINIAQESQADFYAELDRLAEVAEEKSQSPSSLEQLGSVHKKVFSPVGVSAAIIMLAFCLTKVAVAILV